MVTFSDIWRYIAQARHNVVRWDERPPTVSAPSAADTGNRRWIPPSVKRDALAPEDKHHGSARKYRPGVNKDDLASEDKQHATFRKVRGILNKLTPEKFDKLSLELLNVGIDSQIILKGIILLIFEKALDEPKYSSLYATLCQRLCDDAPNFEPTSSNITTFRRLLLNKCQDEFENRSRATEACDKDGPLSPEEAEQLALAKHKMLGNIKFIGELGKLEMLHEGILHKCIKQLLEKKKNVQLTDLDEDLECLCQIMRTVGRRLDTEKARAWMDQYFRRMEMFMANPELPSRIRFLLQDVIELRRNGWNPRKNHIEKGPLTIQQVREEAAKDYGHAPGHGRSVNAGIPGSMAMYERQMNGRGMGMMGVGRAGGLSDIFGVSQPGFLDFPSVGGGDIGTGPGVIHMDGFSPGYSSNMGRNRNNPGFQGPFERRDRRQEGAPSPKLHRNEQHHDGQGGQYYRNRDNQQRDTDNNRDHRDNREHRDNNRDHRDNRDNQREQNRNRGNNRDNREKEGQTVRELPPRFRKQMTQSPTQQNNIQTDKGSQQSNNRPRSGSPREQYGGSGRDGPPSGRVPGAPGDGENSQHSFIKSAASGEEINLRPSKNFPTMFKPNTPSMLPKSAQQAPHHPASNKPLLNMEPKPSPLIQKPPQITIKQVDNKENKTKVNKKNISKEELHNQLETLLTNYLEKGNVQEAVNTMKQVSISNKLKAEMILYLMIQTLDKNDENRENVSKLINAFKDEGVVNSDNFMESLSSLVEKMKELEVEIPLVRSFVAKFAAQAVAGEMVSLVEVSEPFENGAHYPLFMLILQQLYKVKDKEWLTKTFHDSKIDLATMLPECDRAKGKDRLMEILEDRGLSFMFPLLRVQSDLWKQINTDPNPHLVYKWIKESVDVDLHTNPGFINILMTNLLRYITSESSLAGDVDEASMPDKALLEKEKELMTKFKGVLQAFLHDSVKLQLIALYSLQVHCHNHKFPKGMLLRMFRLLYDLEVVDEETFLKWKEEVNDEYPGKGKALFQVNTWLTWLEQAEEESEEEEDDDDD